MRFKIVAIICGILIISFVFYSSISNLFKAVKEPSLATNNEKKLPVDNSSLKLSLTSPFQINTQPKQNSSEDIVIEDNNVSDNIQQNIDIGLINNTSGSTPLTSNLATTSQTNSQVSITGNYYNDFLKSTSQINFDRELVKKSEDGTPLALEELINLAKSGTNITELKDSFLAWHNLDQKVLEIMGKMNVDSKATDIHQELISWFNYHSEVAKKFSEGNLTVSQINSLALEFQQKATTHTFQFKQNLDNPITLNNIFNKIANLFKPKEAEAFTCGAFVPPPFYHFGGRVLFMIPCNFGIVETISPPCGGLMFFSWPVLAANPYLWKKPTIGSAVLGRSVVSPMVCPLGPCPFCTLIPFEATVIYFGTSMLP